MLAVRSSPDFTDEKTLSPVEVLFTIEGETAEMYFGQTPVEVDVATAMYVMRQKETMPEGNSWGDSFPSVINHTSASVARNHPDFHAAKHGDYDAALRLVNDLIKDDRVAEVARLFPDAHVIYNHKIKGDGINMIPAAYASRFAAIGMTVEHDVIAVTNVSHTNASDVARLSKRMRFEGKVTPGTDYILVDDFITSGAELRDLKDYVQSQGGNVVMMTTFGHGSFGKLSDIRIDEDYKQRLREANITDQDLRKYGIASEIGCLTLSEAAKLSRMVNARAKARTQELAREVQRTAREHRADSCPETDVREERLQSEHVQSDLKPEQQNLQAVDTSRAARCVWHR